MPEDIENYARLIGVPAEVLTMIIVENDTFKKIRDLSAEASLLPVEDPKRADLENQISLEYETLNTFREINPELALAAKTIRAQYDPGDLAGLQAWSMIGREAQQVFIELANRDDALPPDLAKYILRLSGLRAN
jgi:hypothetical protein